MKHITLKTASGLTCTMSYSPKMGWFFVLPDVATHADHAQVFDNLNMLVVGSLMVNLADDEQVQKASDYIDEMEKQINMFFDAVDSQGGVL